MYMCYDCKSIFDEPKEFVEPHGETNCFCPDCGSSYFGDYVECCSCGEEMPEDEAINGFCEECLLNYKHNYAVLGKISKNDECSIKLPGLIVEVLPKETIINILYKYITDNYVDCSEYIKGDIDWFADKVKELKENGQKGLKG